MSAAHECDNCGCLERIKHLENENKVQWDSMEKQDKKIEKFTNRITATFITVIILTLSVIANLGYMILKEIPHGGG